MTFQEQWVVGLIALALILGAILRIHHVSNSQPASPSVTGKIPHYAKNPS